MRSIEDLRQLFYQHLEASAFSKEPRNLYEPCNYFLQIGGKRLRPTLLLLACEMYNKKAEEALPAALAIEYFHNFTLIHDDVMDKAPVRRGFTTLHEKYNLNTAILSGDALLVKAYECLSLCNTPHFKRIFDIYTKTAIEVCEGQQYDIDFETRAAVTHEEYIEMIRLKTSVLLAASMQIGAILGGASEEDATWLYRFAEQLGIGFQIQDDLLDCYGDEQLVGKQPGGDIVQNKKTLLLIEALRLSTSNYDERLQLLLADQHLEPAEKVRQVLLIFEAYDIKAFGTRERDRYIDSALEALSHLQLEETKKEVLRQLVNYLVVRSY